MQKAKLNAGWQTREHTVYIIYENQQKKCGTLNSEQHTKLVIAINVILFLFGGLGEKGTRIQYMKREEKKENKTIHKCSIQPILL